ncbi:MAG TPA: cache domain-containing protein [Candidatus Baltobacteraceae bacterium]|nr:cache domain-containing protein [Candidatus Baltobacteraceae bacterium]
MRMSLRVRLLGTIIGAIVLFFVISVVAARLVLQRDLVDLGKTQVTNGGGAFGGYWDSRKDQIRLLVAQDALSDALRRAVQSGNVAALQDQLSNVARTSGLSFLTVVDANGNVVARANGPERGSLKNNALIERALTGETVSTAALLDSPFLAGEGLGPQAQSDIKDASGKVAEHVDKGIAIVSAAPISDQNERTIGAIYGGILMNHYYDLVDSATRALGGSAALLDGNAIVASTIQNTDGTRAVDVVVPEATSVVKSGQAYTGSDTQGGVEYLVHIDPVADDQNNVIGARWYGIPMSRIYDIINHTTTTLVLWGFIAMIIALAVAVPIVQSVSKNLAKRSHQVRDAAKELGVIVVGAEVSGDQVAATKAAVEKSGNVIAQISGGDVSKVGELKSLNDELQSDMIVIDTLSQEMANRMKQAVDRVAELNDVAGGLNQLVTGESS